MAKSNILTDDEKISDSPPKRKWLNLNKIAGLKPLLIIFLLLVVAIILFNSMQSTKSSVTSSTSAYTTSLQYVKELEDKLVTVVGSIKGSGKVKVMISLYSSPELEVAENVEEKTVATSAGTTTTKSVDPIIVSNSPLILKETLPEISGVIVVSSGAKDIRVRLDIMNAVSTALGVSNKIVEVFVGE